MDIKEIRKIIELMKQNELNEFELQDEGFRIAIKRRNGETQYVTSASVAPAHPIAPSLPEETSVLIKSPMVGTLYRSSSPEADPYVSVGSQVEEDTVVCIVEAMKVMNEIKAEVRGIIRKVCVENAKPVQFGQALFIVDPT